MVFNNKGFTLVELIVAAGILGLSLSGIIVASTQLNKMRRKSANDGSVDAIVESIIEEIRSTRSRHIFYRVSDTQRNAFLSGDNLPMAWSEDEVTVAKDCRACPGRYGYLVEQLRRMPGLNMVTLRMTHNSWTQDRVYEFIVGD